MTAIPPRQLLHQNFYTRGTIDHNLFGPGASTNRIRNVRLTHDNVICQSRLLHNSAISIGIRMKDETVLELRRDTILSGLNITNRDNVKIRINLVNNRSLTVLNPNINNRRFRLTTLRLDLNVNGDLDHTLYTNNTRLKRLRETNNSNTNPIDIGNLTILRTISSMLVMKDPISTEERRRNIKTNHNNKTIMKRVKSAFNFTDIKDTRKIDILTGRLTTTISRLINVLLLRIVIVPEVNMLRLSNNNKTRETNTRRRKNRAKLRFNMKLDTGMAGLHLVDNRLANLGRLIRLRANNSANRMATLVSKDRNIIRIDRVLNIDLNTNDITRLRVKVLFNNTSRIILITGTINGSSITTIIDRLTDLIMTVITLLKSTNSSGRLLNNRARLLLRLFHNVSRIRIVNKIFVVRRSRASFRLVILIYTATDNRERRRRHYRGGYRGLFRINFLRCGFVLPSPSN